jgi:hypothetical protein
MSAGSMTARRTGGEVLSQIEKRLERINNAGNLRLEYLKRVYDRRPIGEQYIAGDVRIHVHGFWNQGTGLESLKSVKVCWVCRYSLESAPGRTVPLKEDEFFVLVFISKGLQSSEPMPSVVRLQIADHCDVFDGKAFEIGLNPSLEVVWALTDWKLCSALRRRRIPVVEFKEGKNQLIEHPSEHRRYNANVCADILEKVRHLIMPKAGNFLIGLEINEVPFAAFPGSFDPFFKYRQVFSSPL